MRASVIRSAISAGAVLLFSSPALAGFRAMNLGKRSAKCGPIKWVQSKPTMFSPDMEIWGGVNVESGSSLTRSITETAGNFLVVVVYTAREVVPNSTFTVSDTLGNTYSAGPIANKLGFVSQIFYAANIAGGANQITATALTNGLPAPEIFMALMEYSGIASTDVVDFSSAQAAPVSTENASAPPVTATVCDLVVGTTFDSWGCGGGSSADPSGSWILRHWKMCGPAAIVDNVASGAKAGTSVSAQMHVTPASTAWVTQQIAFRANNTSAPPQPTKLAFLTAPATLSTWTCAALTIQSQDSANQPTRTSNGVTASLSSSSEVGFYADANCIYPITSAFIGAGTDSQTVYYQASAQGTPTLSVAASGFTTITQSETVNAANAFVWIGAAGGSACTSNLVFENNACWQGGAAPDATQTAIFDGTCTASCSPTISSTDIGVFGLVMSSDTLTTLTQINARLAIGNGGFTQKGGTFVGAANGLNGFIVDGPFLLTGGTFTAPVGSATVKSLELATFTQTGGTFNGSSSGATTTTIGRNNKGVFTLGGGTFNAPAGAMQVQHGWFISGSPTYNVPSGATLSFGNSYDTTVIHPGSLTYGNIIMTAWGQSYTLDGNSMTIAGTLQVDGNNATLQAGSLLLSGDLVDVGSNTAGFRGPGRIVLTGNPVGQTVFGNGNMMPPLVIQAGTNNVTLNGNVVVNGFQLTSVGTLTTTGSTLEMREGTLLFLGSAGYNNLIIRGRGDVDMGGASVNVGGNLTIGEITGNDNGLNNGTLNVAGDLTPAGGGRGYGGTAHIVLTGNSSGQTVHGNGMSMPALTIAAGSNPVTLSGNVVVTGYTYTSGSLGVAGSTLTLYCSPWMLDPCRGTATFAPGGILYNHFVFNGCGTTYDLSGSTLNVGGSLTLEDQCTHDSAQINNGIVNVSGDLNTANYGYRGTADIVLVGNSAGQTINGSANGFIPNLTLATSGWPLTMTGNLMLTGNYNVVSVGALTATGSTLTIYCQWNYSCASGGSINFAPGAVTYNNVTVAGDGTGVDLGGGTLRVAGTLTFGHSIWTNGANLFNNGAFELSGDLVAENWGDGGTASMSFIGSAAQKITVNSGAQLPRGDVFVNKNGGSLTLQSDVVWGGAGQNLTITAGAVNMAGFDLTVPGILTIGSGSTLTQGGSGLSYGSLVNNGTLNP